MISNEAWDQLVNWDTRGQAMAIFRRLDDASVPDEDKLAAVKIISDMATHNSVRKDEILTALRWVLDKIEETT